MRIPKKFWASGGLVEVKMVDKSEPVDGKDTWGTWEENSRTIEISRETKPKFRKLVFFHEWAHTALSDSGLAQLLEEKVVEAICDAFATARVAELRKK